MPQPTGPQFQRVYHASWGETPPHLATPTARQEWTPDSNMHPDVVHVGSGKSALDIDSTNENGAGRDFVHVYDIDMSHPSVSPVTWGEEAQILDEDNHIEELRRTGRLDDRIKFSRDNLYTKLIKGGMPKDMAERESEGTTLLERQANMSKKFSDVMSGTQPSLWEEAPADVLHAVSHNQTLPYRNRREDIGSISYIVPKTNIGTKENSPVVYRGVLSRDQLVDQMVDDTVGKNK